jgi:hypothetical protein
MTTLNRIDITPSATLPVSVADAKSYLRIDPTDTSNDSLIERLIRAGADYGQRIQRKSWGARTIRAVYIETDTFVDLPSGPVVSITSVTLPDTTAVTGSVLVGNRLTLPQAYPDGLIVTYVAGTGTGATEQLALLKAVATAYENREDITKSGYTNLHQSLSHLKSNRSIIF